MTESGKISELNRQRQRINSSLSFHAFHWPFYGSPVAVLGDKAGTQCEDGSFDKLMVTIVAAPSFTEAREG